MRSREAVIYGTIAGSMLLGACVGYASSGFVRLTATPSSDATLVLCLIFIVAGSVAGAAIGCSMLLLLDSFIGPSETPPNVPRSPQYPLLRRTDWRHFRRRLARYAGRDEAEVMAEPDGFVSKMPFWSAVSALRSAPPRSMEWMRQILQRIRRL